MEEKQAIGLLARSDPEGLAWLVERHQLKALRTAFLITRERALAEDVVQDRFARLPGAIHSFDRQRPFEPWFLRTVVNAALQAVSHQKRTVSLADLEGAERWLERAVQAPSPEEQVQQAELAQLLWEQMRQLSPQQRAVIVMRYYLGMSEAEMAEAVAAPKGTIKWRLHAARTRLRGLLSADPRKEEG